MVALRRDLHANPELSNQEHRTTQVLKREMEACGARRLTAIEHTGLVVDIGDGEPIVAVRADIDALPIEEETELSFKSRNPGVMHACGHDVHASMVWAVAATALERESELPGTLRIIFQPAEEYEPLGARAVVAQGFVEDVSAIVALHVDPMLHQGQISIKDGPFMSGSDVFTVRFKGESSHAGWPQEGRDALLAAASFVTEAHALRTRYIDPRVPLVLHFGTIEAGLANNIVAEDAVLEGVVRSLDEEARHGARAMLSRVARGIEEIHGVAVELELIQGEPILHNDPDVVAAIRAAGHEIAGGNVGVVELPVGTLNGEDFSFYCDHVKGAMAWLGVRNAGHEVVYPLHHPRMEVDEDALPIGAECLLNTALALMRRPGVRPED
ncbi:MAG: amidohydrolase [Solirubrobacterales bacterium]